MFCLLQKWYQALPAPRTVPRAVDEGECRHADDTRSDQAARSEKSKGQGAGEVIPLQASRTTTGITRASSCSSPANRAWRLPSPLLIIPSHGGTFTAAWLVSGSKRRTGTTLFRRPQLDIQLRTCGPTDDDARSWSHRHGPKPRPARDPDAVYVASVRRLDMGLADRCPGQSSARAGG